MTYLFSLAIVLLTFISTAYSQEHYEDGDHHHDSIIHLGPIDVTGEWDTSSLLSTVPTASSLHGDKLLKKSKNSLGETLNSEVGVNSSQFGPAASRPIIRGLEGDRIRILQNGIGVLDASGTSQDHAVPTNPLAAESIEIVRGPINLLYGSSAIGGVINISNSRIHKNYYPGFLGAFDFKHESVNQAQNLAGKMDYGIGPFMLHLDGNYLKAENTKTPLGEINNSETEQYSTAIGLTYFTPDKNYFGLSYSKFQNIYGVVSETDVDITLKQERIDFSGYHKLSGFLKALQIKSAQSFYKHTEFEEGSVGTIFDNTGNETRLEVIQKKVGHLSGIMGLQAQATKLSALGDEAFLPTTQQSNTALFFFEELNFDHLKINGGFRGEITSLRTEGVGFFTNPQSNNFKTYSGALGSTYSITKNISTSLNLSSSQRPPSYQELYAQGAHLAIGIYEQGDRTLPIEKSLALEWNLRYKSKKSSALFTLFNQDFNDYISLNPTGTFHDTDESGIAGDSTEDFEINNYNVQKARLQGIEFDFRYHLYSSWNLRLWGDYLYGKNQQTQEALPRISPIRVGTNIDYTKNNWSSSLEWRNVFRQTRTATNETSTPSYNIIDYSLNYKWTLTDESLLKIYGQVNNIGNVKARNHVSVIKDKVILPGRNFIIGARLLF